MKKSSLIFLTSCLLVVCNGYAQYGKHLSLNFGLEGNGWQLDNSPKVNTSVSFLDVQYLQYNESARSLLDVSASGLFSTLQGNNYSFTDDDSTQITNSNVFNLRITHFLSDNDSRFGFLWGIDVLSKYHTTGAEEGSTQAPAAVGASIHGEIVGLGVTLGVGYEMILLYEALIIDAHLGPYFVYNSEAANRNGNTFQATGLTAKVQGRYYLTDTFFAQAQLIYENLSHKPVNANVSDIEGKTSTTRFMIGGGIRF